MKGSFKNRLARITAQLQPSSRVIVISGTDAELARQEAELKAAGDLFPSDLLVCIKKWDFADE